MVVTVSVCRWRCSPSGHTRTRTHSPATRTGNTTPAARGATTPLPATTTTTAATTGRGSHFTCVLHSRTYRACFVEGLIHQKNRKVPRRVFCREFGFRGKDRVASHPGRRGHCTKILCQRKCRQSKANREWVMGKRMSGWIIVCLWDVYKSWIVSSSCLSTLENRSTPTVTFDVLSNVPCNVLFILSVGVNVKRAHSHRAKAEKFKGKTTNIKENFCFRFRRDANSP